MERVRASFPATSEGVTLARHFVVDHLGVDGLVEEQVALVTSELAANAVLHAATDFDVVVQLGDEVVRIEVSDSDPALPEPQDRGQRALSGRGLQIVGRLAHRWGAEPTARGKTVWAELLVPEQLRRRA